MKRTITVMADVQVEVDLRRFPTDVLMDEIKDRGEMKVHQRLVEIDAENERDMEEAGSTREEWTRIPKLNKGDHPLHNVYYALKFGKPEHALDLMRDYVSDQLGVVL